jgi:hypothetical protein
MVGGVNSPTCHTPNFVGVGEPQNSPSTYARSSYTT